jgi:hypothetical protein
MALTTATDASSSVIVTNASILKTARINLDSAAFR